MKKSEKLKSNPKKLFAKLVLINTTIIFIALIILGTIVTSKANKSLENTLKTMSLEVLKQIDRGFTEYFGKIEQNLILLDENIVIKELLDGSKDYKATQKRIQHELNTIKETIDEIEHVYYVCENGDIILNNKITNESEMSFKDKLWYIDAKDNINQTIYSEVYEDQVTGKLVLTMTRSILDDNGQFAGVVGIDICLEKLQQYINSISLLKEGFVMLVASDGDVIISHTNDGQTINNVGAEVYWEALQGVDTGIYEWKDGKDTMFTCQVVNHKTGWKTLGYVSHKEINHELLQMRMAIFIGVNTLIIIGVISSLVAAHAITKDIHKINDLVRKVAQGNFKERVSITSRDE
ncbi:MAG: hypothetical protein IJ086_11190, partial [Clostridium sp.]|nr:hypothetical protein [Clostridium sp.]